MRNVPPYVPAASCSLLASSLLAQAVSLQAPGAQGQGGAERVVVTASRTEEDPFEAPRSVDVVDLIDL
jgi:outer membrane receptor protein involved in Fe transport